MAAVDFGEFATQKAFLIGGPMFLEGSAVSFDSGLRVAEVFHLDFGDAVDGGGIIGVPGEGLSIKADGFEVIFISDGFASHGMGVVSGVVGRAVNELAKFFAQDGERGDGDDNARDHGGKEGAAEDEKEAALIGRFARFQTFAFAKKDDAKVK